MSKAKTPIVPHDLLTGLCAVAIVVSKDPKKTAYIQKQLGKRYDVKGILQFARGHNVDTETA